ncbi:hypothetical protein JYU34_007477 [Plutella xylostella]|uniref:MICAL-like protein 1 n=1 Tax=Plutella xylostella TaxID=51655 RepID=A0ABQ7QQH9_PLUXY|nr:hypothetical protein JYU34_007477 [Plutella xylostella]
MSERKGTKALELWCKRLVRECPNVQIDNMTTSWRNGLAFCALVHHFRPDLIDMSSLKPENVYENNQLAFSVAEKHLSIPALLDPEDMVANEVPDRLSVLTYLSQFYQRLGHTVNQKVNENDSSIPSPDVKSSTSSKPDSFPLFGKSGLDKCAACDQPVYLAQRLIVAQKLYHRRCFRCSKCSGHLNPNNFKNFVGSEFVCESCKSDKAMMKLFNNNNDQMGMLAFTDDDAEETNKETHAVVPVVEKQKGRPHSILEKINMFESNIDKEEDVSSKLDNLSLKESISDNTDTKRKSVSAAITSQVSKCEILPVQPSDHLAQEVASKINVDRETKTDTKLNMPNAPIENDRFIPRKSPDNVYKSDAKKYSFLKTQLLGETETDNTGNLNDNDNHVKDCSENDQDCETEHCSDSDNTKVNNESNITDDVRLAKNEKLEDNYIHSSNDVKLEEHLETSISIPPRRKKKLPSEKLSSAEKASEDVKENKPRDKEYPLHLNPFSEDEDEEEDPVSQRRESTNPFGSDDDDEDETPASHTVSSASGTPMKRLIKAPNPFWSDGEEPSSDEEDHHQNNRSSLYSSSVATSTPHRAVKKRAPPPPAITVTSLADAPAITVTSLADVPATSMDDVASLSSLSSYSSTVHSDQKSHGKLTPQSRKKRPAPTPPDGVSRAGDGSMERGVDPELRDGWRRKGPAPGLPLPARRAVRLQLSPGALQTQLELLETQQLGLERQGVLLERMIRDKCEGEDPPSAPPEEVEELVIQLCELVNEKNDLFRKQTELMYIRRQQRLEQEQADIEHEIRVIQSRPAVNRIDADKAREEQLVSRLVQIVRLRDELVQQLDAERRRERQEDCAIAASIASKRAQRHSESNSSSMKSVEVVETPKKSKVKDKMKKQFKKAKHTLIPKKKDSTPEKKDGEKSPEKDKKSKSKELVHA